MQSAEQPSSCVMPSVDQSSSWWKHGIIYHIYPQSFQDSNDDGIGDLPGVISQLDYLVGLGVNAIWLSPVYPSPLIDSGYDISDYRDIHPQYGTLDDFRQLLNEAHQRGIRVIMDLVLNHTSDQHPWFLESRSSRDNPKRNWYIWQPPRNGKRPNNWRTNFGKKAWQYDPLTNEYYYHSFFWEQPDLNWRNPEVQQAMFDIVSYWLEMGVDGFRLDVINLLFKDKELRDDSISSLVSNTKVYSRNQPEIYKILKDFRTLLDSHPEKTSVGEIYTPPPGDHALASSFLGDGTNMLHLAFDFSLIFSIWKASGYYKIISQHYRHIPAKGWPCFFLSNHDIGRSVKRVSPVFHKYDKAKLHALLLLTLRGTPFIYYGDEIGMENTPVPKQKLRDLYGKLFYPFYKGRDGARTPMQWNNTPYAGFTTVEPWLPVHSDYTNINVETESRNEYSVYNIYKRLITVRKQHPVLQSGSIKFLHKGERNLLSYFRYSANTTFLIILNFGYRKKKVQLKKKTFLLFSTHRKPGTKMNELILLAPFEGMILSE